MNKGVIRSLFFKIVFCVVFLLLIAINCFSNEIEIKIRNMTEKIDQSGFFVEKMGQVYEISIGDLTYYIGFGTSDQFSDFDLEVDEGAIIDLFENSKFTVVYIGKEQHYFVNDNTLRMRLFEYLKPVILSELHYIHDGRLYHDGNFLLQSTRMETNIDLYMKTWHELKEYLFEVSEDLKILDLAQDVMGVAFEAFFTAGLSMAGSFLTLSSQIIHNDEYDTLKNSISQADKKINYLIENRKFDVIYEEYPLGDLKEVIDFSSALYLNVGRAKDMMSFITNYYMVRDLYITYGPKWLDESFKHIGSNGFLTASAKKAIKNMEFSLWSLLASVIVTDTKHAQIMGLKIANNLAMQMELLQEMGKLIKTQKEKGYWTYTYADNLIFLMTAYKVIESDTYNLILNYEDPKGVALVHRAMKFIKDIFVSKPDLKRLIVLNQKEIALFLGRTYQVQDSDFNELAEKDLKNFFRPMFFKAEKFVDEDTVFAKLRIQFKDDKGGVVVEKYKYYPVFDINGEKVFMLYLPYLFNPLDYVRRAINIKKIECSLYRQEGDKQVEYSEEDLGFSKLFRLRSGGSKDMILMIHGWQPFNKDAFIESDGTSKNDLEKINTRLKTWDDFIEYSDEHHLDDLYDLYAFVYDGVFKTPEEFAGILAESFENQGLNEKYENVYIIAHSMGGLVGRFFMNERSEITGKRFGEHITKLITINTPHEGSPMGNLFDILQAIYEKDDLFFYTDLHKAEYFWNDFSSNISDFLNPFLPKDTKEFLYLLYAVLFDRAAITGILASDGAEALTTALEKLFTGIMDDIPTILPLLTSDIHTPLLSGLTTPFPSYKSLKMMDELYLENLSYDLFENRNLNIFKRGDQTFDLNSSNLFKDKIIAVSSYIDLDLLSKSTYKDLDLRLSNFLILNELLRRGGESDIRSDGVVPLFSQKADFRGKTYINLGHNQILNDQVVIKDIFDYIQSYEPEEEPDNKEIDEQLIKKLLEKKFDELIVILTKLINENPRYFYYYMLRGFVYDELENYTSAIDDYKVAINLEPEMSYLYNNIGTSYSNLGYLSEAAYYFTQSINLDKNNATVFFNRGMSYHRMIDTYTSEYVQKALNDFDSAIILDKTYSNAYNNRGIIYFNLEQYENALIDYSVALEESLKKYDLYRYYLKNPEKTKEINADELNFSVIVVNELRKEGKALSDLISEELYISLLSDIVGNIEESLFAIYLNRANVYISVAEFEKAVSDLELALDYSSEDLHVHYLLGVAYNRMGEHHRAIKKFEYCLDKGLLNYQVFMNLGHSCSELGLHHDAIKWYSKAFQIKPDSLDAIYNRIKEYVYTNNSLSALSDINTALRLFGENRELYKLKANICLKINDYKSAVQILSDLIDWYNRTGEDNSDNYYLRGISYHKLNDYDNALKDFGKVYKNSFDNNDHLIYMADIYMNREDYNNAIFYYKKFIDDSGDFDYNTYYKMAVAYYNLGDFSNVIDSLNLALHLNPNHAESYYLRGIAYYNSNERKKAISDLKKSAEIGNKSAEEVLKKLGEN